MTKPTLGIHLYVMCMQNWLLHNYLEFREERIHAVFLGFKFCAKAAFHGLFPLTKYMTILSRLLQKKSSMLNVLIENPTYFFHF